MRVLLANHLPIEESEHGSRLFAIALGLQASGHAVRVIDVGRVSPGTSRISVRRIFGSGDDPHAELPFAAPFSFAPATGVRGFLDLSDDELATYRQTLRSTLDSEIDEFDPQIIHCEHVWLFGHLALESGVPYVLTAHRDELDALNQDARYERLAVEAAENAGRVIVQNTALAELVRESFGDLDGRISVVAGIAGDASPHASNTTIAELAELYGHVLDERLGRRWRA